MSNANKELNTFISSLEKSLKEEKEKSYKMQTKLDKNVKELKEMNDYYKTLKTNNDNLLTQYQEKIDEITKDKENLISQNKELLEKLKEKKEEEDPGTNLADIMDEEEEKEKEEKKEEKKDINITNKEKEELAFYKNENKLLNEEIKGLKTQVSSQAHDLAELNSLQKNLEKIKKEKEELIKSNNEIKKNLEADLERIKNKNEDLIKSNKQLKNNLDKEKLKQSKDNSDIKKVTGFHRVQTLARKAKAPIKPANIEKDKILIDNKIDSLQKLMEEQKKDYEQQIEKIRIDMAKMRANFWNENYEKELLLLKYKNTIKAIANQCKLKGIKLSINLVNV